MSSRRKITVTFEVDEDALHGLTSYLEGFKLDGVLQTALTVQPSDVNSLGSSIQAVGDSLKGVVGKDQPDEVLKACLDALSELEQQQQLIDAVAFTRLNRALVERCIATLRALGAERPDAFRSAVIHNDELGHGGESKASAADPAQMHPKEDPPQKVRYLSISNAPGFRAFALHVLAQSKIDANTTFLFSSEDSEQLAQDLFYLHRFVWRIGHRPIDAHPQERRPDWIGQPGNH